MLILGITEAIASIGIWIVAGIYKVAAWTFELFLILAAGQLIDPESYRLVINNFYIVIGIIMLFTLAFALLRGMVNPDDKKQGASTVKKVIVNLVTSGIIMAILPTVFTFAYDFQDAFIVDYNPIGKFFGYGSDGNNDNPSSESNLQNVRTGAYQIVNGIYTAFFYVGCDGTSSDCVNVQEKYQEISQQVENDGKFSTYSKLSDEVASDNINFDFLLSLIAGAVLVYVAFSFCFDMAVRLIKLVFYQLIAPIPIFLRVIPEGKLSGTFNNWVKVTLTCYLEVYIRIFVFYFCIFLAKQIMDFDFFGQISSQYGNSVLALLAKAFVFLGLVTFMRQAPKLFSDVTGLDSGNMKLGIKDKLKDGGFGEIGKTAAGLASMAAAKGNPFAFKRGWKNGWSNIGSEVQRRQEKKDALEAGATRKQILTDSIRKKFGFNASADAESRKIDHSSEIAQNRSSYDIKGMYFDENGNRYEGTLFDDNGQSIVYTDGKYKDSNGNEYTGQLYGANKQKVNELNSKSGLYYYENGNRYHGKIYDDQKNELTFDSNKGIYVDSNGKEYKGQLYDASSNKIRSGFMFNSNDIEALEALKVKNTAAISQASDEIRALEKKIAYGSTQIKFKSNLKGEAESKIDEKGSKVVYGFKYKDLNGVEQTFTGTYKEIEDFRSMQLTAEQLKDTESLETIRNNMIDKFIANEMGAAGDNKIKQNMRAGFNTILNNGGYEYSYYEKDSNGNTITKTGKVTAKTDSNGDFVINQEYLDQDGKRIHFVSAKNAAGEYEKTTYIDGHLLTDSSGNVIKEIQKEYDIVSTIDKLAKGSNNVLNDEKQRIDETIIDGYRGQNEAIDNIVKQVNEQKEAKRKSDEQRAREASKKYMANRGK